MSNNCKKVYTTVNYFEHFLTLASAVTVTTFTSLPGITIRITSSAIGLQICTITGGIKTIRQ